ncbi:MAG: transposase [Gammaproteobacteria bacterium]|nr:transposase [Gammaproteobacteria bacterium]
MIVAGIFWRCAAEPVKALTCYKGIKHLFALTMITEIGDVKRFAHPRQLVSWVGIGKR